MKILIVGGAWQGKKDYAMREYDLRESDFCDGENCPVSDVASKKAVYSLHMLIRRLLEEGEDARSVVLEEISKQEDWIVICDEIGCGAVPVDAFDRAWREAVGRTCCALAERADIVERVICAAAQRIKGRAT